MRPSSIDPCEGLKEWGLFVDGEPADEYVAGVKRNKKEEEEKVRKLLGDLRISLTIGELTDLVRDIDENPSSLEYVHTVPQALRGVAGIPTTMFLKMLLPIGEGNEPIANEVLYGRIRDYTFLESKMNGHLSVDVFFDRREFVPLGEDRRRFFHWDIEISDNIFLVVERKPPGDISDAATYPTDPFPGTDLELPKSATDPSKPRSIWRRGLDHKLHARGEGIKIRNVYYRELSSPDLIRFDSNHDLYKSTAESCVDLFTQGHPPATFGELTGADYCLGRCEHPAIINTGGE